MENTIDKLLSSKVSSKMDQDESVGASIIITPVQKLVEDEVETKKCF